MERTWLTFSLLVNTLCIIVYVTNKSWTWTWTGLSGEMHAGQCHATIFPDFSPATARQEEKALFLVLRTMTALGLQPFLAYPAVIKLQLTIKLVVSREVSTLFGSGGFYQLPVTEEGICCSSTRQREGGAPLSSASGKGLMAGIEEMPAARKKMVREGYGCLLDLFSSCVLGVSCCHWSMDTCKPGFILLATNWLLCWSRFVSS